MTSEGHSAVLKLSLATVLPMSRNLSL